ncbi:uncharacterized protein LOC115376135 [Myripristis murdjan]|uniref:uncharacterized protein LOC115376135 n=1 Tax=Myripristis murdjan TaxID=586833 RepID=UPI0011763B1F|nr:uncharacterized protein LOC115376135 [Myripristis murdjan]
MCISVLLLLLLVCSAQASHFYGTVMTFNLKNTNSDGSVRVVLRYKLSFRSCTDRDTWDCFSGNCGSETLVLNIVDQESSSEWCQREGIMTRQVPTNAPFQMQLSGGNWISSIQNGIVNWRALTVVDLRNRSDTGQANRSPQTTVLPALRVPSNCRRNVNLLAFDPDGDEVKCRYGSTSDECNPCTLPSALSLSESCTLSFSNTSSPQGPYAVQLMMEDFPRQTITLRQTNGNETARTTNEALSKIPVQFVFRVDPVVPSCTEGHYLPKLLPPTPAHGARLYTPVNQTLEIIISAEAANATVSELLFSGPHNTLVINVTGLFILHWTPSAEEDGETHPICFVVQAVLGSSKYHSELRCVTVTVGDEPPTAPTPSPGPSHTVGLTASLSSATPLSEDDIRNAVVQQLREELIRRGVPADFILRLVKVE